MTNEEIKDAQDVLARFKAEKNNYDPLDQDVARVIPTLEKALAALKTPKRIMIDEIKHRRWIASLPCLITDRDDVQCAHIRRGLAGGIGFKPSDVRCVPLSCAQHTLQGEIGEVKFWYPYGGWERAVVLAKALYDISGNTEKAIILINEWRAEYE